VIAGPKKRRINDQIGWREYAHKKVVRKSKNEYRINKIGNLRKKHCL